MIRGMIRDAVLRPLRTSDAPAVWRAFASAADMRRQGAVASEEEARSYVRPLTEDPHQAFAITEDTDTLVGLILVTVDASNRSGWFSYWMNASPADAAGRPERPPLLPTGRSPRVAWSDSNSATG